MSILPALFNTDMVRALLYGSKSVTRRLIKEPFYIDDAEVSRVSGLAMHRGTSITHGMPYPDSLYSVGDILYVRETWNFGFIETSDAEGCTDSWFEEWDWRTRGEHPFLACISRFWYKADEDDVYDVAMWWRPSIHMPKEAARIFLRVTSVRVERLHGMTEDDVRCEGFENPGDFIRLWDSTVKPADRERYGWAANPWVWVIKFERCEKPEGWIDAAS